MDILPTIGMWFAFTVGAIVMVVMFVGIRNSVVSSRKNEEIKNTGKETIALITHAEQINTTEGGLILNLKLEFTVDGEKITARKDVIVRVFNADEFRAGREVAIRYRENQPTALIVMGNATN